MFNKLRKANFFKIIFAVLAWTLLISTFIQSGQPNSFLNVKVSAAEYCYEFSDSDVLEDYQGCCQIYTATTAEARIYNIYTASCCEELDRGFGGFYIKPGSGCNGEPLPTPDECYDGNHQFIPEEDEFLEQFFLPIKTAPRPKDIPCLAIQCDGQYQDTIVCDPYLRAMAAAIKGSTNSTARARAKGLSRANENIYVGENSGKYYGCSNLGYCGGYQFGEDYMTDIRNGGGQYFNNRNCGPQNPQCPIPITATSHVNIPPAQQDAMIIYTMKNSIDNYITTTNIDFAAADSRGGDALERAVRGLFDYQCRTWEPMCRRRSYDPTNIAPLPRQPFNPAHPEDPNIRYSSGGRQQGMVELFLDVIENEKTGGCNGQQNYSKDKQAGFENGSLTFNFDANKLVENDDYADSIVRSFQLEPELVIDGVNIKDFPQNGKDTRYGKLRAIELDVDSNNKAPFNYRLEYTLNDNETDYNSFVLNGEEITYSITLPAISELNCDEISDTSTFKILEVSPIAVDDLFDSEADTVYLLDDSGNSPGPVDLVSVLFNDENRFPNQTFLDLFFPWRPSGFEQLVEDISPYQGGSASFSQDGSQFNYTLPTKYPGARQNAETTAVLLYHNAASGETSDGDQVDVTSILPAQVKFPVRCFRPNNGEVSIYDILVNNASFGVGSIITYPQPGTPQATIPYNGIDYVVDRVLPNRPIGGLVGADNECPKFNRDTIIGYLLQDLSIGGTSPGSSNPGVNPTAKDVGDWLVEDAAPFGVRPDGTIIFTQDSNQPGTDITFGECYAPSDRPGCQPARGFPQVAWRDGLVVVDFGFQFSNGRGLGHWINIYDPTCDCTISLSHAGTPYSNYVQRGQTLQAGFKFGDQGSTGSTIGGGDGIKPGKFVHTDAEICRGRCSAGNWRGEYVSSNQGLYNQVITQGIIGYYSANKDIIRSHYIPINELGRIE
jgi:hypothetical protein